MNHLDRIAVLIPCYNESRTIQKVVKDWKMALPEAVIYVYDNNSADHTDELARQAGAVVRYEPLQGKGNVVRRMFREIDAQCYIMIDGDDTYPADAARKIGKVMVLTLCLNLWTLVPLLQYLSTDIDTSSLKVAAEEKAAHFPLMVEIFSQSEGNSPQLLGDLSAIMPLSLGLVIFCGILVLFVLVFVKKELVPTNIHVFLWSGIGLVIASSNLFPWQLLVRFPLMKIAASYIQFPWRLLAIGVCFLAIAAGYGWEQFMKEREEICLYLTVLVLAMVSSQYYIDRYNEVKAKIWTEYNVTSAVGKNEYLYPGTETGNLLGQVYSSENVTVTGIERERFSVRCSYMILADGEDAYIDLPLLYFPGYTGRDQNGQILLPERGANNLIRVFPQQSEGEIHVFFQEPFLWRGMELVFLAAVAWIIWKYCLHLLLRRGQYVWRRR